MCFTGLCPDWEDWGQDGQRNADEAMALAEKYLGVAKVNLLLGTTNTIIHSLVELVFIFLISLLISCVNSNLIELPELFF